MSEITARCNKTITIADARISVITEAGPCKLIFGEAYSNSNGGVHVRKVGFENNITIIVDESKNIKLRDKIGFIDELIIRKTKKHPINLKYNVESRTWTVEYL